MSELTEARRWRCVARGRSERKADSSFMQHNGNSREMIQKLGNNDAELAMLFEGIEISKDELNRILYNK